MSRDVCFKQKLNDTVVNVGAEKEMIINFL